MMRRLLCMLLVLVLCVGLAVPSVAAQDAAEPEETSLRSIAFAQEECGYDDDDIVRAIVTLRAEPAIASEPEAEASAVLKVRNQQASVQRSMTRKKIEYTVRYTFDTLLNGFSCDVAYGDLDKIEALYGVEAVYIANSYALPEVYPATEPQMAVSNATTGVNEFRALGYNGEGMVVAVLDTGLNTTHEAFRTNEVMEQTGAIKPDDLTKVDTQGVYLSAKVPFAYDYADLDEDITDNVGHGTHVSGTVAGLTTNEDGAWTFCGVAPYAQILSMKIFSDYAPSTTTDIYFQAMEDAYKLGANVINLSIGAQNGFTYESALETEVFGNIYQRLSDAGVILSVAGGNEYSMQQYSSVGYLRSDYQDYGTIASPATYEGSTSIASVENTHFPAPAITVDGVHFAYADKCTDAEHGWLDSFADRSVAYCVIADPQERNPLKNGVSLGYADDFEGLELDGMIAVVQRGELNFADKV